MAAHPSNILVFGATGLIGTHIVNELIAAEPPFNRISIFTSQDTVTRKPDAIASLKSRGITVLVGDFTNAADTERAYQDVDTVVSAVGRPIIDLQIGLLEIAERTPNVKFFYPSEFGTDIEYGPNSKDERPHQLKLKVRKFIAENVKRLQYTYLVTGPYADGYISRSRGARGGSFDVKARKATLLGTGDEKISLTTMQEYYFLKAVGDMLTAHSVGRLVVASLRHPVESRNRALKVNSFTTTPKEILAEFEKQTGAKWEASYTPLDELRALEKEAYEKGEPYAGGLTLRRIWTEGGTLYEKRDNDLIGPVEVQSLAYIVEKIIAASD
jgi:hypothetical protein